MENFAKNRNNENVETLAGHFPCNYVETAKNRNNENVKTLAGHLPCRNGYEAMV